MFDKLCFHYRRYVFKNQPVFSNSSRYVRFFVRNTTIHEVITPIHKIIRGESIMKLNMKVRLKNPTFWLTFIPALITFGYSISAVFGIVPTISENETINISTAVITALTTLGVLVDPTSEGLCDCPHVLESDKPDPK